MVTLGRWQWAEKTTEGCKLWIDIVRQMIVGRVIGTKLFIYFKWQYLQEILQVEKYGY